LFVNVALWALLVVPTAWLANCKVVGDKETLRIPGFTPVPLRLAVCGLELALSITVKVPVRVPCRDGLNVTLITQLTFAANEVGQRLAVKSQVAVTLAMVKGRVCLFIRLTVLAALVVPTA